MQNRKPCDICLDRQCENTDHPHSCDCSICKLQKQCPKFLHATIRITQVCTQTCSHCCFNCGPNRTENMSVQTAQEIQQFLIANRIYSINITGGEFFCNPDWVSILQILLPKKNYARLVTNGDWATNPDICNNLLALKNQYPYLHIAVSNDKWHTNQYVKQAEEFLKKYDFHHIIQTDGTDDDILMPLGRSEGTFSAYSLFSCYCHNPKNMYSFMIDEQGNIYKCPFGILKYARIQDYLKGGFVTRFLEFNQKFYNIFIPSCTACIRYDHYRNKKGDENTCLPK